MILGLGIDVAEVARLKSLRLRWGDRLLKRVFTEAELRACLGRREPDAGLAARFAAKEAAMKALGTGWGGGVGWQDISVASRPGEAPRLELSGGAAGRAEELGARRVHLSLTHDGGVAAAVVVLEGAE